jgi:hypothetical protein
MKQAFKPRNLICGSLKALSLLLPAALTQLFLKASCLQVFFADVLCGFHTLS